MHGYIKYAMDDCNKYIQYIMDDCKRYKVCNG